MAQVKNNPNITDKDKMNRQTILKPILIFLLSMSCLFILILATSSLFLRWHYIPSFISLQSGSGYQACWTVLRRAGHILLYTIGNYPLKQDNYRGSSSSLSPRSFLAVVPYVQPAYCHRIGRICPSRHKASCSFCNGHYLDDLTYHAPPFKSLLL